MSAEYTESIYGYIFDNSILTHIHDVIKNKMIKSTDAIISYCIDNEFITTITIYNIQYLTNILLKSNNIIFQNLIDGTIVIGYKLNDNDIETDLYYINDLLYSLNNLYLLDEYKPKFKKITIKY